MASSFLSVRQSGSIDEGRRRQNLSVQLVDVQELERRAGLHDERLAAIVGGEEQVRVADRRWRRREPIARRFRRADPDRRGIRAARLLHRPIVISSHVLLGPFHCPLPTSHFPLHPLPTSTSSSGFNLATSDFHVRLSDFLPLRQHPRVPQRDPNALRRAEPRESRAG